MKKLTALLVLFTLLMGQIISPSAIALISTNQKYELNNRMGGIARKVQLGTLIQTAEGLEGPALAAGKILVGNGSGVAAAVAPTGDVTINSSGVTAIGSSKVTSAMLVDSTIVDADVSASAALTRSKMANGTADHVVINSGTGALSSEAALAASRGGLGASAAGFTGLLKFAAGVASAASLLESDVQSAGTSGLQLARLARATYDTAGGQGVIGAHPLGVTLPAKAIIVKSFFFIKTQFVDGGAGTVALHCETANNILSAADITGLAANSINAGVSDGAVGNMKLIAAPCAITATVAGAEQTAGKLDIFVEYVVAE